MDKALKTIGQGIIFFIIADLYILVMSISQVVLEGRSGQWNGWWTWQANAVMSLLK